MTVQPLDLLWAPWRMKYVKYAAVVRPVGECIFCKARDEIGKEKENLVLYRGRSALVMLNLFPYNTGHLMVVPFKHVPSLEQLSNEELTELFVMVKRCLKLLRRVYKPDGFNVGVNIGRVAGAGFEDHVHVHIVPRWNGDTNFMPVIAGTKVLPEAIEECYRELSKHVSILSQDEEN